MTRNVKQNRKREPKVTQLDKQGWKSLFSVLAKILVTCAIAAGIPYGVYLYYRHLVETDYFLPKTLTVHGNLRVDDQSIVDASGLKLDGVNLFEVNVNTVEGNIETLPWIKDAKVTITLPDTVDIEIVEHQPLGIVNDGQLYVVDGEGYAIKPWTIEDTLIPPIVSLDKPLADHPNVVVEAFKLADDMTRQGYPHKIQEIHYDDATGYTVYSETSEIRLGYDRFDERIERLLIVDKILDDKNIIADYILLDSDNALDRIVVKPKAPEPEMAQEAADAAPSKEEAKPEDVQKPEDTKQADTAKKAEDTKQADTAKKAEDTKKAGTQKKDAKKSDVKPDKAKPQAEEKKPETAPANEGEPPEKLEDPPQKLDELPEAKTADEKAAMD